MAVWDRFLTEQDKEVFALGGYGKRSGLGTNPALVVIDVQYAFIGDRPEPILESIKRWRGSSGEIGWRTIPVIARLLKAAREEGVPVIYAAVRKERSGVEAGNPSAKNARAAESTRLIESGTIGAEIVAEVAPTPADLVLYKNKPSIFFGTPLMTHLVSQKIDSLIFTGCTTSGCVRASVVDASAYGFKAAVVEEGVFDRGQASHAMSLFDLNSKYADVLTADEVEQYLHHLPRRAER